MAIGYNASIATNGLVLCLDAANKKSYSGSGTTFYDLSETKNNATLMNGVAYNSTNGGALVFDGLDDYVSFTNNPDITGQLSVEVWVKLADPQGINSSGLILGRESSYRLLYSANAIDWVCATTNNGWYTAGTSITAGSLSVFSNTLHIVGTYDGANNRIYVNGKLQATGGSISGNVLTNGTYYLMRTTAANVDYGQGTLYAHRLYNRALSQEEILQNFNAYRGRYGI